MGTNDALMLKQEPPPLPPPVQQSHGLAPDWAEILGYVSIPLLLSLPALLEALEVIFG